MNPFKTWNRLHAAEQDTALDIALNNPGDALVLFEAKQDAEQWGQELAMTFLHGLPDSEADKRFQASNRNGPADAARHCYWSALLASKLSYNAAMRVVFTHEYAPLESGKPDERLEAQMDLHNDRVGLDIGHRNKGAGSPVLRDLVLKALHAGLLRQIDTKGKTLVPTKSLQPSL